MKWLQRLKTGNYRKKNPQTRRSIRLKPVRYTKEQGWDELDRQFSFWLRNR